LLKLQEQIADLKNRILDDEQRTYARMRRAITGQREESRAIAMDAREFNLAAEDFYRNELKRATLLESIGYLKSAATNTRTRAAMEQAGHLDLDQFWAAIESSFVNDRLSRTELQALIKIVLAVVRQYQTTEEERQDFRLPFCDHAPVHRSSHAPGA